MHWSVGRHACACSFPDRVSQAPIGCRTGDSRLHNAESPADAGLGVLALMLFDKLSTARVFHETLCAGRIEFLLVDGSSIVSVNLRKVDDVRSCVCLRQSIALGHRFAPNFVALVGCQNCRRTTCCHRILRLLG
jgi:hypothetical protein